MATGKERFEAAGKRLRELKESGAVDRACETIRAVANPRAAGFNYGAPLPIEPDDTLFADARDLADRLREIAAQASRRAWEIDMAVRAYRIAETAAERAAARMRLVKVFARLNKFSPLDQGPYSPDTPFEDLLVMGRKEKVDVV